MLSDSSNLGDLVSTPDESLPLPEHSQRRHRQRPKARDEAGPDAEQHRRDKRDPERPGLPGPHHLEAEPDHGVGHHRGADSAEHAGHQADQRVLDGEDRRDLGPGHADGLEQRHLTPAPHRARADRAREDRHAGEHAEAPEQANAPADIDTVYLYATPATYTIGKIVYHQDYADLATAEQAAARYKAKLEAEYPGWERLKAPIPMGKAGGAMVSRLRNGPYALIVFYHGTKEGAELAVELEFESASAERKAFKARLREESATP